MSRSFHSTIWGSVNRTSPNMGRYTSVLLVRNRRARVRQLRVAPSPKKVGAANVFLGCKRYLAMSRELWWPAYHRRYNKKTPDRRRSSPTHVRIQSFAMPNFQDMGMLTGDTSVGIF